MDDATLADIDAVQQAYFQAPLGTDPAAPVVAQPRSAATTSIVTEPPQPANDPADPLAEPPPINGVYQQILYPGTDGYWIDEYGDDPHGPQIAGYVVWEEQTLGDGTVQRRTTNVGPEEWRTVPDWVTVDLGSAPLMEPPLLAGPI